MRISVRSIKTLSYTKSKLKFIEVYNLFIISQKFLFVNTFFLNTKKYSHLLNTSLPC
ncbi:hypothetical protein HMPREF3182_00233 [Megasphaera hutchinsoni]|uniref:Uncharacterized protein n=1 Tax=Megasphaera hutchinsoni TaxID=1588748 RepID=A0A134CKQ1_9FIRM|nr:hypothetical protein HMPREF3182_00233 [Megasphaera hutchinsoni]